MKIPKRLKIGSHDYKVIIPYRFTERGDLSGQHDGALIQIRIDPYDSWSGDRKPDSRIRQILLHEIIHAIDAVKGYPLKAAGSSNDEHVIDALSEGLCQVFSDNKILGGIMGCHVKKGSSKRVKAGKGRKKGK